MILILSSPSGAGKTTLTRMLMQDSALDLTLSVSVTTRTRRSSEVDGVHYHFIDRGEFERMNAADELLESAEVHGNAYGTPLKPVEKVLAQGRDMLFDVDWQGARQVRTKIPQAVSIFILPPSRAALEQRLKGRSTDSDQVIQRRLRDAAEDLGHWREFDYVVVNDQFEQAIEDLQAIVDDRGSHLRAARPEVVQLAASLLDS